MKYKWILGFIVLCCPYVVNSAIYQCIDSTGQRIFSDKPCAETNIGQGIVDNFDATSVEVKKMPVVIDEVVADKIRYQLTPVQAKAKYCAAYSEADRTRLIGMGQVVLGMYLSDVIKVWGAPLKSDGNQVIFEKEDELVAIFLIEGCVINIQHGFDDQYVDDVDISTEAD